MFDRAIIINKIDTPDIDLEAIVNNIRETFGPTACDTS